MIRKSKSLIERYLRMLETAVDFLSSKPVLDGTLITTIVAGIAITAQAAITHTDVVLEFLNSIGIDPKL